MKKLSGEEQATRLVVRFIRNLQSWTQAEFGANSGLGRQPISRYEAGKVTPTREVLQQLAAAAGIRSTRVTQLLALFRQIAEESGVARSDRSTVCEELAAQITAEVAAALEPEILAALADLPFEEDDSEEIDNPT